jgi:uncharacterized membrane protein YdjX (TVP38/TMEM64 family)
MSARQIWPRLAVALVLVAAVSWALANRQRFDPMTLEQTIRDLGLWAPLAYAGAYVAITILLLPGSLLGIIGGALFGPVWGTLYTLIAATVGATLAFLMARYLASDWIAAKTGGRLKQLIEGVEREGWRSVAVTRLVPLIPFNILNYALGLTRIRLDVVLVCKTQMRSAKAAALLTAAGIPRVSVLRGGMVEWVQCAQPVAH